MEHLMWFGINSEQNMIRCSSVDAMSLLIYIRGRDFQIEELFGYKDSLEKKLLWDNEDRFWVKKNHYIEISNLIEQDDCERISSININFENGDGLTFSYGQLSVKLSDKNSLKKCTIRLLEQYGYFAAEKIWNFVCDQKFEMPIYYVLGMEEEDIGDMFDKMKKHGKEVNDGKSDVL